MDFLWFDRRRKKTVTVRISWVEEMIINELMQIFNEPKSMVITRALWTVRILYDPNLKLKDALTTLNPETPLSEALKPIPELAHILGVELKIWRKQQRELNSSSPNS